MKNEVFYYAVMVFGVFIAALSQILLKKEADKEHDGFLAQYLNVRVIVAYVLFFISTICTVVGLKGLPLSLSTILNALSYIFVAVLGYIFLKEKPSRRVIAGLAVIVVGIAVYSIKF